MNNIEELLEIFLPVGLLSQFYYEETIKGNKHYTFVFKEKNIKPVVSESNKKLRFKGYKPITLEDYPVRGRKVSLLLKRRIWQIEGESGTILRHIELQFPNTKLEKEFALFFEG